MTSIRKIAGYIVRFTEEYSWSDVTEKITRENVQQFEGKGERGGGWWCRREKLPISTQPTIVAFETDYITHCSRITSASDERADHNLSRNIHLYHYVHKL